jgi:hypothetical protein
MQHQQQHYALALPERRLLPLAPAAAPRSTPVHARLLMNQQIRDDNTMDTIVKRTVARAATDCSHRIRPRPAKGAAKSTTACDESKEE